MFVSFLVATTVLQAVLTLKLIELYIPTTVKLASPVWLYCGYDLEGDDLYSVKWYKNHVEFYRFLPSDNPPGQKYDLVGVYIDLKKSNQTHVYLNQTDLNTEGLYGCEVSTEAPSYRTVQAEKNMKIYVLPRENPTIEGLEPTYDVGDEVNVTCISSPSKPAAWLSWFINGRPVDPNSLMPYRYQRHQEGLQSTMLGLKFIVTFNHLKLGVMSLSCTATVSQEYYSRSGEIVIGGQFRPEAESYVPAETGPTLSTGKQEYKVGEIVEVNCSSPRDKQTSQLAWFVNEKKANHLHVVNYSPIVYKDDTVSSLIGLKFRLSHNHLVAEGLRIKCTASRSAVLDIRSQEIIVGGVQQSSGFHVLANDGKVSSVISPQPL
ncbi:uncharacterized protein LOC143254645 isoform X2 [Tachypleus tridentatus]|uniref:uncharacterized protein LOC143254645 isoform X2 n=1 Tax=Tachypleus tridentatus TaxID=6853 RepID=UPI003FD284D7